MKITYGHLNNTKLMETLQELGNIKLSAKVAMAIFKIGKHVETEAANAQSIYAKLIKTYTKKDENGNPSVDKNEFVFESDEAKKEFMKEYTSLMEQTFEVPHHKLHIAELSHAQLTPLQMAALEPILHELEVLPEAKN